MDVKSRLWLYQISDALKTRRKAAMLELEKIIEETKGFPINYNHYYRHYPQVLFGKTRVHSLRLWSLGHSTPFFRIATPTTPLQALI